MLQVEYVYTYMCTEQVGVAIICLICIWRVASLGFSIRHQLSFLTMVLCVRVCVCMCMQSWVVGLSRLVLEEFFPTAQDSLFPHCLIIHYQLLNLFGII